MILFLDGSSRKILVDFAFKYLEDRDEYDCKKNNYLSCDVCDLLIASRPDFVLQIASLLIKFRITILV